MVVNEEGVMVTETQPETQIGESNSVAETQPVLETESVVPKPIAEVKPMNAEHEAFIAYAQKISKAVFVPQPSEENFCARVKQFIETRGDAMASSDQLLQAYDLFQNNCVENKKEEDKNEVVENGEEVLGGDINPEAAASSQSKAEAAPEPQIKQKYLQQDAKLLTYDDDLGMRPNKIARPNTGVNAKPEYLIKKTNKEPILYFLVILGIASLIYAVNKKD